MTFPETLRELARLRPEKFIFESDYSDSQRRWYVEFCTRDMPVVALQFWGKYEEDPKKEPTDIVFSHSQDDIDSIMAEIGFRVLLSTSGYDNEKKWDLCYEVFNLDWTLTDVCGHTGETEKNPAMQKALTAVVEELKKGEKG